MESAWTMRMVEAVALGSGTMAPKERAEAFKHHRQVLGLNAPKKIQKMTFSVLRQLGIPVEK